MRPTKGAGDTGGQSAVGGQPALGCPFEPRCPMSTPACTLEEPPLAPTDHPDHYAACIYSSKIAADDLSYIDIFPVPRSPRRPSNACLETSGRPCCGWRTEAPLSTDEGAIIRRRVGTVYAVDGIDLRDQGGRDPRLVGESGCGKTSTLLEILNLKPPTGGRVVVLDTPVDSMRGKVRKEMRRDSKWCSRTQWPRSTLGCRSST